jgi:hypothetical protein
MPVVQLKGQGKDQGQNKHNKQHTSIRPTITSINTRKCNRSSAYQFRDIRGTQSKLTWPYTTKPTPRIDHNIPVRQNKLQIEIGDFQPHITGTSWYQCTKAPSAVRIQASETTNIQPNHKIFLPARRGPISRETRVLPAKRSRGTVAQDRDNEVVKLSITTTQ